MLDSCACIEASTSCATAATPPGALQLRKVKEEAEAGRQRQAAQEAGNEPSLAFTDDEAEPEEERMREREAQVQRLRREYEVRGGN